MILSRQYSIFIPIKAEKETSSYSFSFVLFDAGYGTVYNILFNFIFYAKKISELRLAHGFLGSKCTYWFIRCRTRVHKRVRKPIVRIVHFDPCTLDFSKSLKSNFSCWETFPLQDAFPGCSLPTIENGKFGRPDTHALIVKSRAACAEMCTSTGQTQIKLLLNKHCHFLFIKRRRLRSSGSPEKFSTNKLADGIMQNTAAPETWPFSSCAQQ